MKKGEGGTTLGVAGRRTTTSALENGGNTPAFTAATSFHRPGDQSPTKNVYFPRQLNGYHMVSIINT